MYDSIYIYDDNEDTFFSSLIMNELAKIGIRFNNLETTSKVFYKNILIYIPKRNFNQDDIPFEDIHGILRKSFPILTKFKHKFIITCPNDFKVVRDYIYNINANRHCMMYQTEDYDTLCSTIVVRDCIYKLRKLNKWYNTALQRS